MLETTIIGIILFLLIFGIVYLVIFFPLKWFVNPKKFKSIRLISTGIISLLIVSCFLFYSPSSNNEIAKIRKFEKKYELTLTGKRMLMSHDLTSIFSNKTYLDTFKITIPRKQGLINGREIKQRKGYYKYLGTITIENNKIDVDLYYDNHDDGIKDPLSWNGKYKLSETTPE